MRKLGLVALGMATILLETALPAAASEQVAAMAGSRYRPAVSQRSTAIPGPTRYNIVEQATVLGEGRNVFSIQSGGMNVPGVMLGANLGVGKTFELGTSLTSVNSVPWYGLVQFSGKMGLLQEGSQASPISLAGLAGVNLLTDVNGIPRFGFVLGMPLTKNFWFGYNPLILTLAPEFDISLINQPQSSLSGMAVLGLGAKLGINDNLYGVFDGKFGTSALGFAIGIRNAFAPTVTGDLFFRFNSSPYLGTTGSTNLVNMLGFGLNWQ